MIKSTFDIDTVAEAVGFWIPGFRADLVAGPGDTADYRLRCTRNELIEDFDVHVAVQEGAAEVTVTGADGESRTIRWDSGNLYQDLRAVPSVLHHLFHRLQMTDGPGQTVQDLFGFGVVMSCGVFHGVFLLTIPPGGIRLEYHKTAACATAVRLFGPACKKSPRPERGQGVRFCSSFII